MAGTPTKKAPASKATKKTTVVKKPAVVVEKEVEVKKENIVVETPIIVESVVDVDEKYTEEAVVKAIKPPAKVRTNPKECGACRDTYGQISCGCCVVFEQLKK